MNSLMPSQYEKAIAFRDLHSQAAFIMPNPWDVGTRPVSVSVSVAASRRRFVAQP